MGRSAIDITGQKFNYLTVIKREGTDNHGRASWLCQCDCGKTKVVSRTDLISNFVKSCGCKTYYRPKEDITGQRFGKLTVLRLARKTEYKGNDISWLCKCDCGKEVIAKMYLLLSGKKKSCGCIKQDKIIEQHFSGNVYNLDEYEYGICYCKNNNYFIFDKEDYEKIKDYIWFKIDGGYYGGRKLNDKKIYRIHRVIMDVLNEDPHKVIIDHIHGKESRYDNRKSNLRIASISQNIMNAPIRINNTSGTTGVSWNKYLNKWEAYINFQKQRIRLGYFENKNDAIDIRKKAEEKYFGEFSYNNSQNRRI